MLSDIIAPGKLRAGDPQALAVLVAIGGWAVVQYCEQAGVGDEVATTVALTFVEFRRRAIRGGDGPPPDLDRILLDSVRDAVDEVRGGPPPPEQSRAAEEAFARANAKPLSPRLATQVLHALVGAAPVEGDPMAVRTASERAYAEAYAAAAAAPPVAGEGRLAPASPLLQGAAAESAAPPTPPPAQQPPPPHQPVQPPYHEPVQPPLPDPLAEQAQPPAAAAPPPPDPRAAQPPPPDWPSAAQAPPPTQAHEPVAPPPHEYPPQAAPPPPHEYPPQAAPPPPHEYPPQAAPPPPHEYPPQAAPEGTYDPGARRGVGQQPLSGRPRARPEPPEPPARRAGRRGKGARRKRAPGKAASRKGMLQRSPKGDARPAAGRVPPLLARWQALSPTWRAAAGAAVLIVFVLALLSSRGDDRAALAPEPTAPRATTEAGQVVRGAPRAAIAASGTTVEVVAIRNASWAKEIRATKPSDGTRWVTVSVRVKNLTRRELVLRGLAYRILTRRSLVVGPTVADVADPDKKLRDGRVPVGARASMHLGFEVPQDAKDLMFALEPGGLQEPTVLVALGNDA